MLIGKTTVREDPRALARYVAGWLTDLALAASGSIRIALAGGSTPRALYSTLASEGFRSRFPWDRASFFWGDERFVPADDPASNYGMVGRALLAKVPVPRERIHPIPVDGPPEECALRYQETLQRVYGSRVLDPRRPLFDVTLLGLGSDGHTASLFPGHEVLGERRRWVAAVPGSPSDVRITLTYPALESSRWVAFLVTGAEKARILAELRTGKSDAPAARLRPTGELFWFADRAAAGGEAAGRTERRYGRNR